MEFCHEIFKLIFRTDQPNKRSHKTKTPEMEIKSYNSWLSLFEVNCCSQVPRKKRKWAKNNNNRMKTTIEQRNSVSKMKFDKVSFWLFCFVHVRWIIPKCYPPTKGIFPTTTTTTEKKKSTKFCLFCENEKNDKYRGMRCYKAFWSL